MLLTAMLAGVLAFLLHALVDFPFVNPSLAFFEYLLAGLFLARLGLQIPQRLNHSLHRAIAGVLMVATAFAIGASARVYVSDYILGGRDLLNVGNARALSERREALTFLLESWTATPTPSVGDRTIRVGALYSLIPNLKTIQSFAVIRIPMEPGSRSLRPPAQAEAIAPDSLVFITDPTLARSEGAKAAMLWLDEMERLDALYPKNSELALYMVGMYTELLKGSIKTSADYQTQLGYSLPALSWAEKAIERNPMQSVCWQFYGLALTYRANIEPSAKALDYYDQMLAAYKKATELYPIGHIHWYQYSDALRQIGELYKLKDPQRSEALLKQSQEARERAQAIEKYRTETGI
jgi:tetratricopeptide (TPR) repeat protein